MCQYIKSNEYQANQPEIGKAAWEPGIKAIISLGQISVCLYETAGAGYKRDQDIQACRDSAVKVN